MMLPRESPANSDQTTQDVCIFAGRILWRKGCASVQLSLVQHSCDLVVVLLLTQPFNPKFPKWILPSLNFGISIIAKRVSSQN